MSATPLPQPLPRPFGFLLALSVVTAVAMTPVSSFAQSSTAPTSQPATLLPPTTSAPSLLNTPKQTSAATSAPETVAQPFVGTISADRVYVRSGPGSAYYEMGQLSKGDTVEVVGARQGWYQILPPNGTFCMVAKELLEVETGGATGTTKADYVNIRAGTALSKNREPSAVLTVVRKGTKLAILGSTDKYYEVAPPEKAYVFISPQFVKKDGVVAEYKVPELKLTAGAVAPAKNTVTAPTTLPSPTVEISPAAGTESFAGSTTGTTAAPSAAENTAGTRAAAIPAPARTFASDAYSRFNDLNARYQAELQKPVGHRELDPLIKDYKTLAASDNLPPSVQQGSQSRIAALEKLAAIQRLQQENTSSNEALAQRQRALQEEYAQAQKAISDYEQTGPYIAQGRLQASTAVEGKYALVNPVTGRVVAYVDPQADVDIASLMGKYIGVRGVTHKAEGSDITVIQVKNATLMAAPGARE